MTPKVSPDQNNQDNTSTIVTIILLLFFFPAGFILMWFWTKWPTWVKLVITAVTFIPIILIILFVILPLLAVVLIGGTAVVKQQSECQNICQQTQDQQKCENRCINLWSPDTKLVRNFDPETLFSLLNKTRDDNVDGNQLRKEEKLCSYADYLLGEYKKAGVTTPNLIERDAKNPAIVTKYFSGYTRVFEHHIELEYAFSQLPDEFTNPESSAMQPNLTGGCFSVSPAIKSNYSWIQFVGGY